MNKLLLIAISLLCCSWSSFGQTTFEMPRVTGMLGTITFLPGISDYELKNVTSVSVVEVSSSENVRYNQILAFKAPNPSNPTGPEISFSDGSKMPIIDLSKGYISNLPIKEIFKNFNSKMPITELTNPNLIILPKK